MKKLFGILTIAALVGFTACQPKGPTQEEFDALSKTLTEKEAIIVDMEAKVLDLTTQLDSCNAKVIMLEEEAAKKPGAPRPRVTPTPKPQPAAAPAPQARGDMKTGTQTQTQTGSRKDMKRTN